MMSKLGLISSGKFFHITIFIFLVTATVYIAGCSRSHSNPAGTDTNPGIATGVFGSFYSDTAASTMSDLRQSGFTTVLIWSIHIDTSGDLSLNDDRIVSEESYIGYPSWPGLLATLKNAPTSVNRIEISIGAWGTTDFQDVKRLIDSQGIDSTSILYRNFRALKIATGADAADFDDEDLYDSTTTVAFGDLLASLGYKISLCPYRDVSYWQAVKSKLGSKVDAVWLQCYAGGAGNDPAKWSNALGITVYPGLWSNHGSDCSEGDNPSQVQTQFAIWKATSRISGGFMWHYDDIRHCGPSTAAYASAIKSGLGG
jgi:hypothetical protein